MTHFIFKNQELLPETQGNISIHDRGFRFGDSVFETCKIFNGCIYDLDAHLQRLKESLNKLDIHLNCNDIAPNAKTLIAKNNIQHGILHITISRGCGSMGYFPKPDIAPLTIIQTFQQRPIPHDIALGISDIKTPNNDFGKSGNALAYVMTKINAKKAGLFDAVMLSEKGFIAETSSANIFWVKNNAVFTPSTSCDILQGTVRQKLLTISDINITESEATIESLKKADEIFLTNSSFLLLPVDRFLDKTLDKTIAHHLLALLHKDLEASCKQ